MQAAGDERLTCDGVTFPLKGCVAVFQVLRAPAAREAGRMVHYDYSAGEAVAGVSLQIPAPPTITSPQPGAQIARGPRTLVTYRFDPATASMLGIVALAPASPSPKALARMHMPGPLHATIDTSGLSPAPARSSSPRA